jgi:hypothetical protein
MLASRWIGGGQKGTHCRYDPSWRNAGHQQVGRNLPNNITDGPDRNSSYELIPIHLQVFLHAAKKSIVDITLVEIFEKVAELRISESA